MVFVKVGGIVLDVACLAGLMERCCYFVFWVLHKFVVYFCCVYCI